MLHSSNDQSTLLICVSFTYLQEQGGNTKKTHTANLKVPDTWLIQQQ